MLQAFNQSQERTEDRSQCLRSGGTMKIALYQFFIARPITTCLPTNSAKEPENESGNNAYTAINKAAVTSILENSITFHQQSKKKPNTQESVWFFH